MGIDEASEHLLGVVRLFVPGNRAIVVLDVLTLVCSTGNEGLVEDGSGLRAGREFSVHLGVLGKLELRECGSAGSSTLWDMGVDGVTVPSCCQCGVVGDGVEVYHGVQRNHVRQLRCDIFWGGSFEVLSLLVVCRVIRRWVLECGWESVEHTRSCRARRGWRRCRCLGGIGGGRCRVDDEMLCGGCGC